MITVRLVGKGRVSNGPDTPQKPRHSVLKILVPYNEAAAAKFRMVTHGGMGVFLRGSVILRGLLTPAS